MYFPWDLLHKLCTEMPFVALCIVFTWAVIVLYEISACKNAMMKRVYKTLLIIAVAAIASHLGYAYLGVGLVAGYLSSGIESLFWKQTQEKEKSDTDINNETSIERESK